MKNKAIEFNADDLVGSAESFAEHLKGGRKLTLRVKPLSPAKVRAIRRSPSPFNEADLVGSMNEALAHAQGKLMLKTTTPPSLIRHVSSAEKQGQQ